MHAIQVVYKLSVSLQTNQLARDILTGFCLVGGLPPSPSNVPMALFVNANGQPHCKTSVGLTNSRQLTLNISIVLSPAVLVTKDSASAFKMVPKVECK